MIDELGGPDTYNHYPTGWAVAFSTPFRMFKRYSLPGRHLRSAGDPLAEGHARRAGEVRNQYHHVTDIVPTILECCGIEFPGRRAGLRADAAAGRLDALQLRRRRRADDQGDPVLRDARHPRHLARGLEGRRRARRRPRASGNFDEDVWQLFHTDEDRSEAHDLADEHPEKLKRADRPLVRARRASTTCCRSTTARRSSCIAASSSAAVAAERHATSTIPGTAEVPERVAANIRGRSYKILADVEIDRRDAAGRDLRPRLALRWPLAVHQGREALLRLQLPRHPAGAAAQSRTRSTPGKHIARHGVRQGALGEHGESHGTAKLYVDDEVVAEGPMRTQTGHFALCGDGLCIGRDSGDPVSEEYTPSSRSPAARSARSRSTSATTSTSTSRAARRRDGARLENRLATGSRRGCRWSGSPMSSETERSPARAARCRCIAACSCSLPRYLRPWSSGCWSVGWCC